MQSRERADSMRRAGDRGSSRAPQAGYNTSVRPEPPLPAREPLSGSVERITFHNEESGFAVLRVLVRGHHDLVTVVGHIAAISPGEFIQASGNWINDRQHGVQFSATHLQTSSPTTAAGIERYLGSGLIKGIGPHFAKRLVDVLRSSRLRRHRAGARQPAGGGRHRPRARRTDRGGVGRPRGPSATS